MSQLEMLWILVRAQARYQRSAILWTLVAITSFIVPASLFIDRPELLSKVWALGLLFSGLTLNLQAWMKDQQERRSLGWIQLPISPRLLITARLTMALVLQLVILLPFLVLVPVWLRWHDVVPLVIGESLLSIHAFSLVTVMSVFLIEELSVIVYRWGWKGVLVLNLLAVAAFLLLSLGTDGLGLPDLSTWSGAAFCYSLGLLLAAMSVRFYTRRRNYLVGINACHGMPEDWSRSAKRA